VKFERNGCLHISLPSKKESQSRKNSTELLAELTNYLKKKKGLYNVLMVHCCVILLLAVSYLFIGGLVTNGMKLTRLEYPMD
jgi:hypothetical protein